MVESASDEILRDAQNVDVAFLVVGDPFGYTSLSYSFLQILNYIAIANVFLCAEQQHTPTSSSAPANSPSPSPASQTPQSCPPSAQLGCNSTISGRQYPWYSSRTPGSQLHSTTVSVRTVPLVCIRWCCWISRSRSRVWRIWPGEEKSMSRRGI